jgi:dihydroxyacid dehydratase/phosphogluconate dehydratase
MAAASVDLPAVVVPGGPMLTGTFRGVPLGCGTDVWRRSEEVRAGTLSAEEFTRSESAMIRSRGHCNTMGTASTMALVAEALGTVVPGVAGTPAADSRLLEAAHGTGRLVVRFKTGCSTGTSTQACGVGTRARPRQSWRKTLMPWRAMVWPA